MTDISLLWKVQFPDSFRCRLMQWKGPTMPEARPIRDDISAAELRRLARLEDDGRVACRLLALANAVDGMSRAAAAERAGMDRQTLRDWVVRFNEAGVEGLGDRPRSGRPPFLNEGQLATLARPGAARPRSGARRPQQLDGQRPLPAGRDALRRGLQRERDAAAAARSRPILAEDAAGAPAGRSQGPRALQKKFPALIAEVRAAKPEAQGLEVWFLDEARIGQTGRTCRRWFEKGERPRGRRDLRHEAVYLFGAVCPEHDKAVALVLPEVGATAMQPMLDELGRAVTPDAHAVVLMDRAGWHCAKNSTSLPT